MKDSKHLHTHRRNLRRVTTLTNVEFTGGPGTNRGSRMTSTIHDSNLIFKVSEFVATISNNLFYLYLTLASALIYRLIFTLSFYVYYTHNMHSLHTLLTLLLVYALTEACFIYPFCRRYFTNVERELLCFTHDILARASDAFVYLGLLIYVHGKVQPHVLWAFTLPKFLTALYLRFRFLEHKYPVVLTPNINLLEATQWLAIGLNFSLSEPGSWELITGYYFVYAICLFMLSLLVIAFVPMMATAMAFQVRANFDLSGALLMLSFFFYFAWNGWMFNRLFSELVKLVSHGLMRGQSVYASEAFYSNLAIVFWLSLTNLLLLSVSFWVYNYRLRQGEVQDQTIIDLADFCKELNMGVKDSEDVIFLNRLKRGRARHRGKVASMPEESEPLIHDAEELCLLCQKNEADIYIKPCEHSGMCTDCMKENLEKEFECPVCHQPIDKIYMIEMDRDTEKYIATPFIVNKEE